jgi:hypothetical protein
MSLSRICFTRAARACAIGIVLAIVEVAAFGQTISTTTVQGTVYLANGSPGSGTLQVIWPAFTTASNQVVAAGKLTLNIGTDGFVSVNLVPNLGSSPAGLYYTAIYHMNDGTTNTEFWIIPAAAQASIAQVRSQVMPAAQAVQAVSKTYVDQAIQSVAQGNLTSTGGQLTGPLYLTGDPTQALQAADKHYVDTALAQAVPLTGGTVAGPLTAKQLGASYQVDQFAGPDFGAKLQACIAGLSSAYGGTCDARNFSGNLLMAADLTISTANVTVMMPCATISTAKQIVVSSGTRNVSLRGCSMRGASNASGSQGGTVLLYSGAGSAVQVGDPAYAADTLGFHIDNLLINVTASSSGSARAIAAYRTQEINLESLYLLGNANQTGITLDGTGNYTGGTFYDNHISGFQTAINAIGHQIPNSAATDWLNASTFVRLHINCPTTNGNPISGTYGINLLQGDGNSFTGGDVEGCATALHLGANAQNNTIVGLRNENSTFQVVADAGSSYNSWMTGGTMYTGKLSDSGTRNSFLDTFHRSFNSLNGDWYGSQQDSTITNHFRLGIGNGNERGMLDRYQTDYGYRWTMGLSDGAGGEQYYQLLDELNNVYRISVGQYNPGQAGTNNQTVINSAGSGAVVLNGSNNAGTGGVVFGSGGPNETTVATVGNSGNAQFNGTLQVGGTTQSTGTMTVRNNTDAEVDYYLWPGLTTSQKGAFTYKDYNGNSQWYMVKDASNNWALNSAPGGLDSFKAYQSTNSGDTYVNASNSSGVVRVNYEAGSGSAFNVYGGGSGNLYASFSGTNSIKLPGLSAASGRNCLQIDSSGYISNTGVACGSGSGTVNSGSTGQIAYYNNTGSSISGMSTIPVSAGGTGAATAGAALSALGGAALLATAEQKFAGPITASINSQINVMAPPYNAKGDGITDDAVAINAACTAAKALHPAAVVYFPKPSNVYLTSTLTQCTNVSLLGQAPGTGNALGGGGVTLRGKPGQDIIHGEDPNTVSAPTFGGSTWSINHIQFMLDDSIDASASFPHRWPGRWTQDGAITSGSAVLTATKQEFTCSDVGSAIRIKGAGTSGADLITTIASLPTCNAGSNGSPTATLATTASTTVANALVYTSVPGTSATQTLGNCSIGEDNFDGNSSNWHYRPSSVYASMQDVSFVSVSGTNKNNSCAIYLGATWQVYGFNVDHVNIQRYVWGVVQGTPDTNPGAAGVGQDYQKWTHMLFQVNYPWVSYDGSDFIIQGWQLDSQHGPIISQYMNATEWAPGHWLINVPEFEQDAGGSGWIIKGNGHEFQSTVLAPGGTSYLEAFGTHCSTCLINGPLTINNSGNHLEFGDYVNPLLGGGYVDNGTDNVVVGAFRTSPYKGSQPTRKVAIAPTREQGYVNSLTPDFLTLGNPLAPYSNQQDLLFFPDDYLWNGASPAIVTDSNSFSGKYIAVTLSGAHSGYAQFNLNSAQGALVIGKQVPATQVVVYDSAKCPSGTTYNMMVYVNGVQIVNQPVPCNTSYITNSLQVDLSSYAGQTLVTGWGLTTGPEVDDAWSAVVPVNTVAINQAAGSTQIQAVAAGAGAGATIFTANNWTIGGANTVVDPTSPVGYSSTVTNSSAIASYRGLVNLTGGTMYAAVPSVVSVLAKGPVVWTDTLAGAMAIGDGTMTIKTPTTSAWPSTAFLQIGQEIVKATGVTAGLTTLTISRGQYGTLAQAHSNGATYTSVGHGTYNAVCGSNGFPVNMIFTPTWQWHSAPFNGSLCSGVSTSFSTGGTGLDFAGQTYQVAAVSVTPVPNETNATAANQVAYSVALGSQGYQFTGLKSLAGSGAGITTGPNSGTTTGHITTFSGTTGQIQDSGATLGSITALAGTTGSIGGAALTPGQCASGTVVVAGATTSMVAVASASGGISPGFGFVWQAYVNAPGSVTVQVCALVAGTPAATTYNVRVIQ